MLASAPTSGPKRRRLSHRRRPKTLAKLLPYCPTAPLRVMAQHKRLRRAPASMRGVGATDLPEHRHGDDRSDLDSRGYTPSDAMKAHLCPVVGTLPRSSLILPSSAGSGGLNNRDRRLPIVREPVLSHFALKGSDRTVHRPPMPIY